MNPTDQNTIPDTNLFPVADSYLPNVSDPTTPPPDSILLPPTSVPPKRGFSKRGKIITMLGIAFLLFVAISIGAMYALAYHKIELTKYPDLQKKVEFLVMELPFTPKSARYLVYKQSLTLRDKMAVSQSFDMSTAINTNGGYPDLLGFSNFDIAAKGDLDFKDKENLLLNMNLSVTKDFNMDIKAKDKFVYFKVNKVPEVLLALAGLNSSILSPLMNVWVSYDTTPLQTEARDLLKENDTTNTSLDEDISKQIETYLDQSILSQMVVTNGEDGGATVYKMHLTLTPQMIDDLNQKFQENTKKTSDLYVSDPNIPSSKLSDGLKDVNVDIWLDSKNYYTRRVSFALKITPDSHVSQTLERNKALGATDGLLPSLPSTVSVATVFKFGEFGKNVLVDVPTPVLTFEEFTKRASEVILQIYMPR